MRSKQNNPPLFGLIHLITAPEKHAHVFRGFLFTLVLGFLCALPATANAQALVQTTGAVTTTAQLTLTANYAGTPVNGHLLVAVVATRNTETTVTLTSPGATNPSWTGVAGNDFFGLAPGHGIFYRVTGAVETTNVTVTVAPTSTLIAIQIYEFSGIDTANPLYNFNSNFGAANPLLTDDIIPNRTPYLAVATFGINTSANTGNYDPFANTGTNTQPWIQQADQKAGAGATARVTLVGGYKVPATTGTVGAATNWSQANIEAWKGEIAVFNASGPTAANGSVSGIITDSEGHAVEGTVVNLSGSQSRKTITNAKGFYQFDNVETSGFYTVTPARSNYSFSPSNRSFSALGNHTDAAFTGSSTGDNANPLDTVEYFVRQQYVDILGREPDEGGFNYWSNEILSCGGDSACTDRRRREVAASFFIAEEFQDTGSFIYDMYKGTLGRKPVFNEYSADRKQVVGGPTLTAQKAAFADSFVQRTEFVQKYQGQTTADSFVDALLQNVQQSSQLDLGAQRSGLINQYNSGGTLEQSRSLVLRSLADNAALKQKEYNAAFVLTEYFGYLRRNPEPEGYDFWLNVVTNGDAGNYRGMVCSFITSTEYQRRFSSVVSHGNSECGR
jgi:hypothetical protein